MNVSWSSLSFDLNQTFLPWYLRSSVFRGCAVPPWVHVPADKAISALLRPAAGRSWKTTRVPTERLPSLTTVHRPTITLALLIANVLFSIDFYFLISLPLSTETCTAIAVAAALQIWRLQSWNCPPSPTTDPIPKQYVCMAFNSSRID